MVVFKAIEALNEVIEESKKKKKIRDGHGGLSPGIPDV